MNPERENILRKLMHKPNMSFNELWEKEGESNKFAYHMKVLEEDELIEKTDSGYQLTHKGKRTSTYVDGSTGRQNKAPLVAVIVVVSNNGKYLLMQREKEPFYGYWGFIGGKIEFNQYILECAESELEEETGLRCNLELKGLFSSKTQNNNELAYNHQIFIVKGTNPTGKLKKTREGKPEWVLKEKIKNLKTFPNVHLSIDAVEREGFNWIEADRFQENDEFKEMIIKKDIRY